MSSARAWPAESCFDAIILQVGWQLEQPDGVRNRRPLFTGFLADLFMAQTQFRRHPLESDRQFDWVQVLALDVLDNRQFENLLDRRRSGR